MRFVIAECQKKLLAVLIFQEVDCAIRAAMAEAVVRGPLRIVPSGGVPGTNPIFG
jgi:hypothetical protein